MGSIALVSSNENIVIITEKKEKEKKLITLTLRNMAPTLTWGARSCMMLISYYVMDTNTCAICSVDTDVCTIF